MVTADVAQWIEGLSAGLQTSGLPVQFLVRTHAREAGPGPGAGRERQPDMAVSLSLFFLPFPTLSK